MPGTPKDKRLIPIDADVHAQLKVYCDQEGVTMAEAVRKPILSMLRRARDAAQRAAMHNQLRQEAIAEAIDYFARSGYSLDEVKSAVRAQREAKKIAALEAELVLAELPSPPVRTPHYQAPPGSRKKRR